MKTSKFKSVFGAVMFGLVVSSEVQAATVVFEDDFEVPVNSKNWQVYQSFGDWSASSGAGIEIQTSGTVSGVQAHSGDQYVELDSDPSRGGVSGDGTNSSMTADLNLEAGFYQLEFFYRPRTNTLGDNVISVFLDADGTELMSNLIDSVSDSRTSSTTWALVSVPFQVLANGLYGLTFAAGGIENKLGGFIDSVTLRYDPQQRIGEVPLPAAAWLFLSAFGAGGLLRRFKRQG